jgi:hypothetical protein
MADDSIWVTARLEGDKWSAFICMRGLMCRLNDSYKAEHVAYMAGVQALRRLQHATPIGAHTENIKDSP